MSACALDRNKLHTGEYYEIEKGERNRKTDRLTDRQRLVKDFKRERERGRERGWRETRQRQRERIGCDFKREREERENRCPWDRNRHHAEEHYKTREREGR